MIQHIPVNSNLQLQLLTTQDAPELHALKQASYNHLLPFVDWIRFENPNDIKPSEDYIKKCMQKYLNNQQADYKVLYNNAIAGLLSFNTIDLHTQTATIGYWLGNAYIGKKIIPTCIPKLIDAWHQQYNIKRFVITAREGNIASNKIAQSLNFKHEGTLKRAERIGDTWYNQNIYALVLN